MGLSVLEGLAKAGSMILVSEIGDKTFFLAALMAMRHPRRWVMAGSLSALWIMTLLSATLGWAAPNLLPRKWTHALATLLFLIFGLRSLWDGIFMEASKAEEEMKEAEEQLNETDKNDKKEEDSQETPVDEDLKVQNGHTQHDNLQNGAVNGVVSRATRRAGEPASAQEPSGKLKASQKPKTGKRQQPLISPVFFQAFSLIFFGEWGDKSQIATIGLASEENVIGVALGGCLGHLICNGAAVMGGRHLATTISERMVAILGGLLFLAFAAQSFVHGPPA